MRQMIVFQQFSNGCEVEQKMEILLWREAATVKNKNQMNIKKWKKHNNQLGSRDSLVRDL